MAKPKSKPSLARKWLSVASATVLLLISYALILLPIVAGPDDGAEAFGASLGVGLALVPLVFLVAAFMSQHERAALSIAKASGLWFLIASPIAYYALVTGHLPLFIAGLVAGYGAGGVVAFRLDAQHSRRRRVVAVVLAVLYTYAIVAVAPVAGLFGGAVMPFIAIAFADEFGGGRRVLPED